jgi:hypothetical protein
MLPARRAALRALTCVTVDDADLHTLTVGPPLTPSRCQPSIAVGRQQEFAVDDK